VLIAVTLGGHTFEFDENYGQSDIKFTHSQNVYHQNFKTKKAQKQAQAPITTNAPKKPSMPLVTTKVVVQPKPVYEEKKR